jgi:hypothetical protein
VACAGADARAIRGDHLPGRRIARSGGLVKTAVRTLAAAVAFTVLLAALWLLRPTEERTDEPAATTEPSPVVPQQAPRRGARAASGDTKEEASEPEPAPEPAASPTEGALPSTPPRKDSEWSAVLRGLWWLARHQAADGGWGEPGTTGIAMLAFLGAGETHQRHSKCGSFVRRGLDHLRALQREDGSFVPSGAPHALRDHAVAAVALVEAYGMTSARALKEPAQRAVRFAAQSRTPGSAWGRDGVIDLETTVWMSMLLKSATMSDLDVDVGALSDVIRALDQLTDPETGRVTAPGGSLSDEAATAIGVFLRLLAGRRPRDDAMIWRGADVLAAAVAKRDAAHTLDEAAWFFGTRATWQLLGKDWRLWYPARRADVDAKQLDEDRSDDCGSWDPPAAATSPSDRVWSTSLSLLGEYPYQCSWYPRAMDAR